MPGEDSPKRARLAAARRRPGAAARRPADRHYLAVVAAEARRLGRQLRPAMPPTPIRPEGSH